MTTYAAPICLGCAHSTRRMEATREQFRTGVPPVTGFCAAFPEGPTEEGPGGIPVAIWRSSADHRKPFAGDRGIRYTPKDARAATYPDLIFRSRDEGEDDEE